jgi:hypothetical protein
MALVKTLVCLANSRKLSDRCVAGMVDGGSGEWVRPVSARPSGAVSVRERQYEDETEPSILDIVSVPLLAYQPHDFQSENWLLDPDYYWVRNGRVGWQGLLGLEQHPSTLWINGSSSRDGTDNRVTVEEAATLPDSLKLIHVTDLVLQVHTKFDQSLALRAYFSYAGHEYKLAVTDPDYEQKYIAKPVGSHQLGESFLTISLGEPFMGYAYKLVAAIIERAKIEAGSRR